MKKKLLLILAFLVVFSSIGVVAYNLFKEENPVNEYGGVYYENDETEKFDVDKMKEIPTLFPDLASARPDRGEVILSLPAGEGDSAYSLQEIPDMIAFFESPESETFAVSDRGEVYIGGKSGVRVFRDNKLVSVLQFPLENADMTNVPFLPVGDMTVIDGTLYVADMYTNRISAVVDGKAVPLDLGDLGNIESIGKTPSGKLLLVDNYWKEGSIRYMKFDLSGEKIAETKQGFFVSEAGYSLEDGEGNIVRMIDNGFKSYIFVKETKDGKELASVPFSVYSEELYNFDEKGSGHLVDTVLIGTDGQGRMYIDATARYYIGNAETRTERFLIRLDIERHELSVQRVDHVNYASQIGGGIRLKSEVDADGNVYLAFVSLEDGAKIVKYDFDE